MLSLRVLIGRGLDLIVHLSNLSFPLFGFQGTIYSTYIAGIDDGEDPPVPIPNTEVKLTRADDTWGEAPWENK